MRYFIRLLFIFAFMHAAESNAADNFLVLSDIHLQPDATTPMEISPARDNYYNDLDPITFKNLMAQLALKIKLGIVPQPNFIVILGDIAGHHLKDRETVAESEAIVFKELKQQFPLIPLLYTFGNNDSLRSDYGPFSDLKDNDPYKSPFEVAQVEGQWLDGFLSTGVMCNQQAKNFPCLISENSTQGYYATYLKSKLRLLSLNSVLFSVNREHVSKEDAHSELDWLEDQLKFAKSDQESVLVAFHIPPGKSTYNDKKYWKNKDNEKFLQLLKQYQNTIMGVLASHSHVEELKIIRDSSNSILSGIYFTASLSTAHGNEPSVKTFYFSAINEKWQLINYETFHFFMDNNTLNFSKLYDYKDYYCMNVSDNMTDCLNNITRDKMEAYLSAGNPYYNQGIHYPDDIIITTP